MLALYLLNVLSVVLALGFSVLAYRTARRIERIQRAEDFGGMTTFEERITAIMDRGTERIADMLKQAGIRTRSWTIESKTVFGHTTNHIILPCTECGQKNRLTKGAIGAVCASCKAPISDAKIN